MADPLSKQPRDDGAQISNEIGRKAGRKLKAREERDRGVWFGLGMFGLVGWAVAIPTVLGVLLGLWLDGRFPGRISWTLTFLFLGVVLGCVNAWFWVLRESEDDL